MDDFSKMLLSVVVNVILKDLSPPVNDLHVVADVVANDLVEKIEAVTLLLESLLVLDVKASISTASGHHRLRSFEHIGDELVGDRLAVSGSKVQFDASPSALEGPSTAAAAASTSSPAKNSVAFIEATSSLS